MNMTYWNDIEEEKKKPYFIENENDPKLWNFFQKKTNLYRCFEDSLRFYEGLSGVQGRILEIGAGVGWTSAILSQNAKVTKIYAIDYSEHRLQKIAPVVFKQFKGNFSKFYPVVGNILQMDFSDEPFDAVLFCQSLYMFSDLKKVADRIYSFLRPGGE